MSTVLEAVGLPELIAIGLVLALNAYVITGGADFGGGVWDLLARGRRRRDQRQLIAHSIGPIWEANHVWLILVIVMLFTGFPPAFATLGTVLHIPLSVMLFGIVLRGSSFVFRTYGSASRANDARWSRVFAIASVITPMMFGLCVGAIVSGAVGAAAVRLSSHSPAGAASFRSAFIDPWLAPFPLAVGAMALAMFAFLAAVYLAAAAHDDELRNDFRRRAIAANVALFLAALAALMLAKRYAAPVKRALTGGPALVLQVVIATSAVTALSALAMRRWRLARVGAAVQASLVLWGWVIVQYPMLVPPVHTIRSAAAPRATLQLLAWAIGAGGLVLFPSLAYLFRTFAGTAAEHAGDRRSDRITTTRSRYGR